MKKIYLLTLMLLMTVVALAQVTTSSISGKVVDEKGQPLIGATIQAIHTPTGTSYATSSVKNGLFNIGGMRIGGPYTIEITFIGYNPEKIAGVNLTLGEEAKFNVKLNEATQTVGEVVVIGKSNPVFNSSRTGAQEVITKDMMSKLPTLNRSLSDFTKLTPMSSGGNFGGTSYRFNNVTVDGASFNNSFGLASSLGAKGTEPISLEAIEQVQVMIAPFDVRNGAFTGAGINSVTKSGSNNWEASAYMYMKHPDLKGYKQKTLKAPYEDFSNKQYGISIGGPIIKNKLFFFINGEMDRQESAIAWKPRAKGATGQQDGQSIVDEGTLQDLSDFLGNKFEYNPGAYNMANTPTEANRITARLDWNINSKNTLSVKYFFLKSFNTNMPSTSGATGGSRSASEGRIPFSSSYYRTNSDFNIIMTDLNTTISNKISNTLKVGYSRLRDYREMDGGVFPQVDILNGVGWKRGEVTSAGYTKGNSIMTTFGTEENSYNNKLDSDIFQIQDNLTINLNKHQLTVGTQSDLRKFVNGYARSYAGVWEFNSVDAFKQEVADYAAWKASSKANPYKSIATKSTKGYKFPDEFPYAEVSVLSLGFYVQDKWTVTPNLNLTLGLRVDTPIFLTDLDRNEALEKETFQGGQMIDVSKYPKTTPMFSPRLGVNWDVLGNKTLQVRGGTGLFAGTPPYVWLSNQAGNNGLLFGSSNAPGFDGDVNWKPENAQYPTADIALVDPDFKYPQLWKTNIAIDGRLGNGWMATAELLYNKDVNSIYHANIALPDADSKYTYRLEGPDNRIVYKPGGATVTENQLRSASRYGGVTTSNIANTAIAMKNTSKGYSVYTTFKIAKEVHTGLLRGLYFDAAYTFGRSKGVTDGSSSVAKSAWQYRPAINPNGEEVGFNAGGFKDRFLLTASYRKEYAKNYATSVGLVFERYSPFRFSYTYFGDLNNDGINSNDLIFVPASKDQINLVKNGATDTRSTDEIWEQLNNFINQDSYLSKRRGQYTERNGGMAPYVNRLDVNVTQDFFVTMKNGKRNTIRLTLDIYNFGNLLCRNWGVQQTTVLGFQQYQFLNMVDGPSVDAAGKVTAPTFTMPFVPKGSAGESKTTVLDNTFRDYYNEASRWSIQFGIKYMFN